MLVPALRLQRRNLEVSCAAGETRGPLVKVPSSHADELCADRGASLAVARAVELAERTLVRIVEACLLDMAARYELGRDLFDLRYERARTEATPLFEAVSKRMGVHSSALRRWSRVSGTIPRAEFVEYLSLRTCRGSPLTWSHLELLAEVTPSRERRALATECVAEELTVRSLAARVRGCRKVTARDCLSFEPESPDGA